MLRPPAAVLLSVAACAPAAPSADLVSTIPGFPGDAPFKTYAGYLDVPGPIAGYSSLRIAYIFNEAIGADPQSKPLVAWHQGGPGGNSFYGLFGEMGYYQVSEEGLRINNATSWNRRANMLYLDAPSGSNDPVGFSTCSESDENGLEKVASICRWDDKTQAVAYAHTLLAFYKAFPEFSTNDLYLTGESYAGQYLPNIGHTILTTAAFNTSIPLKGMAVGNGCWGGDEEHVVCNGENSEQNDLDNYWGKGLISNRMYHETYSTCGFKYGGGDGSRNSQGLSADCDQALEEVSKTVGPHDIYDIYDNCPGAAEWHEKSGKSPRWLRNYLRAHLSKPSHTADKKRRHLAELAGGYAWPCGGINTLGDWLKRPEIMAAFHFEKANPVEFDYNTSGPASITLWPFLAQKLRVLIYNGDADDCVPYHGNEEWTTGLEAQGVLAEKKAWHPWYNDPSSRDTIPQGYATSYDVVGSDKDFTFITIRLAGHMVPAFRNDAAFAFFSRFLEGTPF
jgi:hypothetical protein